MTSLNLPFMARKFTSIENRPAHLYRRILKELPRILMIYDVVNIGEEESKNKIRQIFYDRAHLKDPRVVQHLVNYGFYELEETMLQHKQKHHVLMILDNMIEIPVLSKVIPPNRQLTEIEQERRYIDEN